MKIKRIAALILIISLIAAMFTVARATESEEGTTTVSSTEEQSVPDTTEELPTEPTEPTEPESSDVAEISICTRASGFPAFFHTWIYIKNLTDKTLKVGVYELPAGEGVSVGTWALAVIDGWGVYYNIEAHASADRDGNDYLSLTKTLDAEQFEKVSREVSRFNWWDPVFNCTVFTYRVWNAAGGKWLLPIPLPWFTHIQMLLYGGRTGELEMFVPEKERVFRQRGWGNGATLEEVSDWTRNTIVAEFKGENSDVTA